MQFGKLKLDRCRYGWMLHSGPFIGKCFELYGQYSEAEVEVLRVFLKPGATALDVGANIGDLTIPMAQLVGSEGRVYAFESHSDTFQVLNANLALNAVRHVKALNAFVADAQGVEMAGVWGAHGYVSPVWAPPVMAIDDLALPSCAFIKVDVDGKELEVLRSAERTIAAHRPVLYVENDDREKSPALLRHLMDGGYTLYFHAAPIFSADNYFGNAVNHWAPQQIVSLMILAVPQDVAAALGIRLPAVTDPDAWWPGL